MATRRRPTDVTFEEIEDAKAALRTILEEHAEFFRQPPRIGFVHASARGGGLHVFIAEPDGSIRNITNELRKAAGIALTDRGEGYSPERGIVSSPNTFQSASADLRDVFSAALGADVARMQIQVREIY